MHEQDGDGRNRKEPRDAAIEKYNNSFRDALRDDVSADPNMWKTDEEKVKPCASLGVRRKVAKSDEVTKKYWTEGFMFKVVIKLDSRSPFTCLLDQIHTDEDIMFKFYHSPNRLTKHPGLRERAPWLVESINAYRIYLVVSVLEKLKSWVEGNEAVCGELLGQAEVVFINKVSKHGRPWSARSWRNRARLYWLLAQAGHAAIAGGRLGAYKNGDYSGPIRTLVQKMIEKDEAMLLGIVDKDEPFMDYTKVKYDKREEHLTLGTLKMCSPLAWASAVNDRDLVMCILKHKVEYMKRFESDYTWEESWEKSWADALWNAAYMGHDQIVKELLHGANFPYHKLYFRYYSETRVQPPLHVAVRRGHISVVEAFCTGASASFSCHDDNGGQQTPLELATKLEDKVTKRIIQTNLLRRPEVKQAVEELNSQREMTVGAANAIIVGAVLIASVAYGGWLQPPLGYDDYHQFTEPLPAPPGTPESYMSVEGDTTIQLFAICNSLSFFFAIAAVIAGLETTCFIEAPEETYIAKSVYKLRHKLKRTMGFFILSVICVLIAFASAGIAILPPIEHHRKKMYITIGVGGLFCMVFIVKLLLLIRISVPKLLRKQFEGMSNWIADQVGSMSKRIMEKFR